MFEITKTQKLDFERAEIRNGKLFIYTSEGGQPITIEASVELITELKKNIEAATEVTSVLDK